MKKLFFALLVAATALVGCGPDNTGTGNGNGNGNGNGGDKPFYGIQIDEAMFTNRGDFYDQNNGTNNYILRFSTLGEVDGEEMAVAYLTLEVDVTLDENGRFPEGTYTVANGDIYPGEVMNLTSGTFYVDFTQQSIDNAYMFATSGELVVKHLNETEYQFTITLKGKNYNGGQGTPYEGRYEGEPSIVGLGATTDGFVRADDFVGAEGLYLGATEDGKTALWQISMYDEGYYELVTTGATTKLPAKYLEFFLICENKGPEALPKGTFTIDMLSTYSDNTVLEAYYSVIESYEFDAENNTVVADFSVNDYFTDGYVKISPQGTTTIGKVEYPNYKFDIVGYGLQDAYKLYYNDITVLMDGTEEPTPDVEPVHFDKFGSLTEIAYLGPQAANEAGTVMTKPFWMMQLMFADEQGNDDKMLIMELFTKDGNTFEEGIPSGTYTVPALDENLDITAPNIIFPGYYEVGNDGYLSGIYGTYIVGDFEEYQGQMVYTMLYDCVQGGTMTVENKGDGNYKIDMNFVGTGNMSYSDITVAFEGKLNGFDATAVEGQAAKMAAKSQKNNKVELAGEKRFKVEAGTVTDNRRAKTHKSTIFERNFR